VQANTLDTIRALFTYLIALIVIAGGGLALVVLGGAANANTTTDTRVVIAGFVGSALTFVFGSEVQTRTARQAAAQTSAATSTTTNGNGGSH
jgi:hypothetical protein